MICRIWRGCTSPENASAYESLLTGTIMPAIAARNIEGFRKYHCMRRDIIDEDGTTAIEFSTIMWFDSVEAIRAFVGEDYEVAHIPDGARRLLKRF